MGEKNELLEKLKRLGITCWEENGQVIIENIPVCVQNENLLFISN